MTDRGRRAGPMLTLLLITACAGGSTPAEPVPDLGSPRTGPWELVWQDEFEGSELDDSKWSIQSGDGCDLGICGWGNNELQWYDSDNVTVASGRLVIEARPDNRFGTPYTSGRIRSKGKGDWRYARVEVRARLPEGRGLWPAIWMLPTDEAYGGWAASGEIDIMELVGHEPATVHGTLHYGDAWPDNRSSGDSYTLDTGDFSDDFHVFRLDWEHEGIMRWYVDGELYQTQTQWSTRGASFPAPFDQRFHLLLNVAVGGNWPGNPDGTTSFPQRMEVDWVRVYLRSD